MTATPVEVAQVIARRLGLSGALGTVAESVDGVYTGRLVGEPLHGPAKARPSRRSRSAGPGPVPVRGLLRLRQRHPDALARRPPLRRQPRRGAARPRPRQRLAGRGLPPGPPGRTPRPARRSRHGARRRARRLGPPPPARRPAPDAPPAARVRRPGVVRRQKKTRAALHQQRVERLLDRLAHLVGEVEHQHRVVRRRRAERGGLDRRPNSMIHLLGSGISPSGPSSGKVGVIGTYGAPISRATVLMLPMIG